MCSISSVCSKRFSAITMSMTYCSLMLASFGASSSTVRFHPLDALSVATRSETVSLCQCLFCMRTHDQARNRPIVPCCVMGLTSIRGFSHLCLSRFNCYGFAFCIFGQTNVDPHPIQLLQPQRPNDIITLVLPDAFPAPRFCSLLCRLQT